MRFGQVSHGVLSSSSGALTWCGMALPQALVSLWSLSCFLLILFRSKDPGFFEIEKEIVREVARADKPYLRKSTGRKAQIRKALVQFSGLICALRYVDSDFLR